MKAFQFRLETVLEYKQNELDAKQLEYANVLSLVKSQQQKVENIKNLIVEYNEEYCQKKIDGMTITEMLTYQGYFDRLYAQQKKETDHLKKLEKLAEEKLMLSIEAKKDTRQIEKLKELNKKEYDIKVQKAEERSIEEFFTAKRSLKNA